MQRRIERPSRDAQSGGITILAALMLLVLMTAASLGMSRNALRDIAIAGTGRQGSMAHNVADSGIEWAVYWIDQFNSPAATGTAQALNNMKVTLGKTPSMAGIAYDPITQLAYDPKTLPTPPADTTINTASGTTQGYTVAITGMGKLPMTDTSQGVGQGDFTPAAGAVPLQAPDLWAIRVDSQVTVGTAPFAMTFVSSKEGWVSTPPQ